jgi:hypothetical protein
MNEDIRDGKADHRQQPAGHRNIERDRNQRRMRERAGDDIAGVRGAAVFLGSTRASMWKRSPGSEAERVVGA